MLFILVKVTIWKPEVNLYLVLKHSFAQNRLQTILADSEMIAHPNNSTSLNLRHQTGGASVLFCMSTNIILLSLSIYFNSIVGKISGQLKDEQKILNVVSHNKYILYIPLEKFTSPYTIYLVSSFWNFCCTFCDMKLTHCVLSLNWKEKLPILYFFVVLCFSSSESPFIPPFSLSPLLYIHIVICRSTLERWGLDLSLLWPQLSTVC